MKNTTIFMQNKPNSPNVQMNVTNLITMNYTIFASLTKVKNKPNQTQFKPKTNPIAEMSKMNENPYITMNYKDFIPMASKKTKPNKAKVANNQSSIINNHLEGKSKQIYPRMSQSGGQFQTGRRPPSTPYLPHSLLKIYTKNASIINKLLIYNRFLIDNSIVLFTRYKD